MKDSIKIPPKWIIGNWKMYKTIAEALDYIEDIIPHIQNTIDEIGLAVPFTQLRLVADMCEDTVLHPGAQNVHSDTEGAFTGEISAEMVQDAGGQFTLVGHSERRHVFHESDVFINKKVLHALKVGLKVVLCIGETVEEKNSGKTREVLLRQLREGLKGVDAGDMQGVSIAYEPVWAIGTGVAASPDVAQECHAFCRELITELYGKTVADKVKILYGGSVQPDNVGSFLEKSDINGVLVGKASLTTQNFAKIINFRKQ